MTKEKDRLERSVNKLKIYMFLIVPILAIWGIQPLSQGFSIESLIENGIIKFVVTLAYFLLFNYIYFDIRMKDMEELIDELKKKINQSGSKKGLTDIVLLIVILLAIMIIIMMVFALSGGINGNSLALLL